MCTPTHTYTSTADSAAASAAATGVCLSPSNPNRATANADATRDGDSVRTFARQRQPRRLSESPVRAIQTVSLGIARRVRASNVTNAAPDVYLQKVSLCRRCITLVCATAANLE